LTAILWEETHPDTNWCRLLLLRSSCWLPADVAVQYRRRFQQSFTTPRAFAAAPRGRPARRAPRGDRRPWASSYHREQDRPRTRSREKFSARSLTRINLIVRGVMMLGRQSAGQEMALKGSVEGKTLWARQRPAGLMTREVVAFDGRV